MFAIFLSTQVISKHRSVALVSIVAVLGFKSKALGLCPRVWGGRMLVSLACFLACSRCLMRSYVVFELRSNGGCWENSVPRS